MRRSLLARGSRQDQRDLRGARRVELLVADGTTALEIEPRDRHVELDRVDREPVPVSTACSGLPQSSVQSSLHLACAAVSRRTPFLVAMGQVLDVSLDVLTGCICGRKPTERPQPAVEGSPDMRRLLRRLRRAKPKTIHLLSLIAAALEGSR